MNPHTERLLQDYQRLLWREDVEGICPTPDSCFEYGKTVRCSPCAIRQSRQLGVEPNLDIPFNPEIYRMQRELQTIMLENKITEITPYYNSLMVAALRYKTLATIDDLINEDHSVFPFIDEFIKGIEDRLPLAKLNRWLGYIQGTLIAHHVTTVEEERDFTRPLFRPLDFPNDLPN